MSSNERIAILCITLIVAITVMAMPSFAKDVGIAAVSGLIGYLKGNSDGKAE